MLHDDDMPLLLSSRDTLQHKQTELFYFEVNVCGVLKSTEALLFVLYSGTRHVLVNALKLHDGEERPHALRMRP